MSVYVDEARWPWKGKMWAHLWADTEIELHDFAKRLGLRRSWFQDKNPRFNHYDVTSNKRRRALAAGAVKKQLIDLVRERMAKARV